MNTTDRSIITKLIREASMSAQLMERSGNYELMQKARSLRELCDRASKISELYDES